MEKPLEQLVMHINSVMVMVMTVLVMVKILKDGVQMVNILEVLSTLLEKQLRFQMCKKSGRAGDQGSPSLQVRSDVNKWRLIPRSGRHLLKVVWTLRVPRSGHWNSS